MRDNFSACLTETLRHEGGWADDPRDPGGATMKGVTLATYRQWRPGATKAQLRAITDAEVAAIYRKGYWDAVRGDDLPAGLDLVAFDAAVNSGAKRGAQWLQAALGVPQDGKIGRETLRAADMTGATGAINRACDARLAFMKRAKHPKTGASLWATYGRGWSSRVASVRAAAHRMAHPYRPAPKPDTPNVRPSPNQPPARQTSFWAWLKSLFGG